MRTNIVLAAAMSAGIALHGADLFEENSALKTELKNQTTIMQPLHQKNQDMKGQLLALDTTNKLVTGELKTPPSDAPLQNTIVIWDFKTCSPQEMFNQAKWNSTFAENIEDNGVMVLKITNIADVKCQIIKYFSKEEMEKIKGKKLRCSTLLKVEPPKEGKAGAVFMAMGSCGWRGSNFGQGPFDWKKVSFDADIPIDGKGVALILGWQGKGVGGAAYYKDLKVEVID